MLDATLHLSLSSERKCETIVIIVANFICSSASSHHTHHTSLVTSWSSMQTVSRGKYFFPPLLFLVSHAFVLHTKTRHSCELATPLKLATRPLYLPSLGEACVPSWSLYDHNSRSLNLLLSFSPSLSIQVAYSCQCIWWDALVINTHLHGCSLFLFEPSLGFTRLNWAWHFNVQLDSIDSPCIRLAKNTSHRTLQTYTQSLSYTEKCIIASFHAVSFFLVCFSFTDLLHGHWDEKSK